ncbi:hypothetical protein MCHLDSM_00518 [Mycolicibacterium chlorophenolicum]|uniref:Uncharacterized protein n=2 Tax=Mycolicibacterium TaxID=1866885 RepID=A0A0J6WNP9_9MYCO|nr:hypothetical protein MCHLDSM_00518 [Mycolicibacterium chlorophenolicum]MCV7155736.1 hypothetical protein [Mycolicibacterium pyrenivorans]
MAPGDTYQAGSRRLNRNSRRWARFRRAVGSVLVVVGSAMAVAHLIAHLASMRVVGALDLLIGFPMAVLLVLVGLLLIGLQSVPPRSSRHPADP